METEAIEVKAEVFINQPCINDVFGYCKSTPDYIEQPIKHNVTDKEGKDIGFWVSGGKCKFDKAVCEFYIAHLVVKDTVENPEFRLLTDKIKEPEKKVVKKKKSVTTQTSFL